MCSFESASFSYISTKHKTIKDFSDKHVSQTWEHFLGYTLNPAYVNINLSPFLEPISSTIRPEIPSSLVSNESSGSLLSEDVPGYEIWT